MSHESPSVAPHSGASAAEWFIYYQIASADLPLALKAVIDFQQRLQGQWPGLTARVLQRLEAPGTAAGRITLMETYRFAPHAGTSERSMPFGHFDAALDEVSREIEPWLQGPRHVERFAPCAW